MDCLANTGDNAQLIKYVAVALIVISVVIYLFFRRHLRGKKFITGAFMIIALLAGGGLTLRPQVVNAASDECVDGSSNSSGVVQTPKDKGPNQLTLLDDAFDQNYFTFSSAGGDGDSVWTGLFSILSNDKSPQDDPVDPNSIRLSSSDSRLTDLGLVYYEDVPRGIYMELDGPGVHGTVYLDGFNRTTGDYGNLTGKVRIELNDSSWPPTLPPDFKLVLYYTAKTMSGRDANNTATVAVTTPPAHFIQLTEYDECGYPDDTMNLLDYASTTRGALDPLTIDLDPYTPGRQTSYANESDTISVNSSGIVSFSSSQEAYLNENDYYFTIGNTMGDVSSVGIIHTRYCPQT